MQKKQKKKDMPTPKDQDTAAAKQTKNKRSWRLLPELFFSFFKIGAFTFGGGYAMIPLIERETVEKKKWVQSSDILDIIAIAESTPGPISVNTATFVGYRTAGVLGAVTATFGLILPSFVIIFLISSILARFQDVKAVQYAFRGVRAGVLALVLKAFLSMAKKLPRKIFSIAVAALAFAAVAFFDINVLLVLVLCAVAGLIHMAVTLKKAGKRA